MAATLSSVVILIGMLWAIIHEGAGWLSWSFLTNYTSVHPEKAGILSALVGSLWLIGLTAVFSVVVGVGAAVYLEEYARDIWFKRLVQLNISNLAGVPSIVYGILGLVLFVRGLSSVTGGRSVLSGALTLTLVVLPIVIIASQEALRAVPKTIRQASYALAATRWQTVWHHVLPAAMPGMMTGVILSLSRAFGEAAPLIIVGAWAQVRFVPSGMRDEFTVLPIQIFEWSSRPQAEFRELAAAAILVLLVMLLCTNGLAVFLRYRYGRKVKW
ncbi:MAG: phosphate ABC transporter permease PstA [Planctomycetales bacterium]|nr:phosphate ABC transporter permease PstA [Planctomycetales bacterium]